MTVGLLSVAAAAVVAGLAFPGQAGNLVGHAATPAAAPSTSGFTATGASSALWPGAYPGSLTAASGVSFTSGTATNPTIVAFQDFQAGVTPGLSTSNSAITISGHDIIFVGCRFGFNSLTNSPGGTGVKLGSGAFNIQFIYCTGAPLTSFYTSPPGAAWPSAGAGQNTTTQTTNTNCASDVQGYQFWIGAYSTSTSGSFMLWLDHCDAWGFANGAIDMHSTTGIQKYTECWFHDTCNASPSGWHSDAIGYYNGGAADGIAGPGNVTINHCTLASLGNSNCVAFQAAGLGYTNITVNNCYLSGYGNNTVLNTTATNLTSITFTNNTFGTDVQWDFGPLYTNYTTAFQNGNAGGNVWTGNTLNVLPGSTKAGTAGFSFTSANNGQFLWPDSTLHTTDF